jgi:hypothetical protein
MFFKKSKKGGASTLIMSFVYDILFLVFVFILIFGFLNKVDSGMHYWRKYYSEDLSLTLTLLEGIPEDLSVNYVVLHNNVLPVSPVYVPGNPMTNDPIKLMLQVKSGLVSVFSLDDPKYKTDKEYISYKNSKTNILAPFQSIIISKEKGNIDVKPVDSTLCQVYNTINNKFFVETSVYFGSSTYGILNDISDKSKAYFESYYHTYFGVNSIEAKEAYTKNIIMSTIGSSDIAILSSFRKSSDKTITVMYDSTNGNVFLANNVACKLVNILRTMYSNPNNDFNIYFQKLPSGSISSIGNTGLIIVEFKGDKIGDFNFINPDSFAKYIYDAVRGSTDIDP